MPELEILPSEVVPKFGIDVKPRPGDLRGWAAYHARHPRLALPAPKPVVAPPRSAPKPIVIVEKKVRRDKPKTKKAIAVPLTRDERLEFLYRPPLVGGRPLITFIISTVSAYYGVSVADMRFGGRTLKIVIPRQIAMYLARELTTHSLPVIAYHFGKFDHTTALHAYQKIKAAIAAGVLAKEVSEIRRVIMGKADPALAHPVEEVEAERDDV